MKQVAPFAPITLLAALFAAAPPAMAANQPGDYSFTAAIGQAGAKNNNSFRSDQALTFALHYQKTRSAAYRAMAGFLTLSGREEISPTAGTRDADAFFVTGDIVFTPRFRVMNPFLAAGVGFYDLRLTDSRDSSNGLELGINWGFGLDVQILRWFAIHGEVGYHFLTGSLPNPVQTIVVGGRFDF